MGLHSVRLLLLLLTVCAFAADLKTEAPKPISELHATKFELLIAKQQLAEQAVQRGQAEQRALYVEVCRMAGIEAADFAALSQVCAIDLEKRTVTKRKPAAPADSAGSGAAK